MSQFIQYLLSNATSPGVGAAVSMKEYEKINVQVVATASGNVGVVVIVEGSYDGSDWFDHAVIDMAGITAVADGKLVESFPHMRARLAAISGTDAKAMVFLQPSLSV